MREDAGGACDGSRALSPAVIHFDVVGNVIAVAVMFEGRAKSRDNRSFNLNPAHLAALLSFARYTRLNTEELAFHSDGFERYAKTN